MENKKIDKHAKADSHKKIAEYYQTAAKHHLEAAKHCEAEDCGKAAIDTIKAYGFACAAKKHFKKIALLCADVHCCDDAHAQHGCHEKK